MPFLLISCVPSHGRYHKAFQLLYIYNEKNTSKVLRLQFLGSAILLIFVFLLLFIQLLDQVIKFFTGQSLGVTS